MVRGPRLAALSFFVAFMGITVFSIAFVAVEAGHDCAGEGCLVCYHMGVCENALKLGLAFAVLVVAGLAVSFGRSSFSSAAWIGVCRTPVTLKVKLSN